MTDEDIDLGISIAFDKLAWTQHQQPWNYLSHHKHIILKAAKEIRSKKKRPELHSTYDYVMNSAAFNVPCRQRT